jgi:outer membrane biosynthesis protein TonB
VKRSGWKKEPRERFSLLLILSLLIHATLILLLAYLFAKKLAEKPPVPPEPPMPEVTLELPPPERPTVDAKEITDKAPEKAPFESDQNSKAATELPATGTVPLPTQEGITQPNLELANQKYTPGEQPASPAGNPVPPHPATPPAPEQPKPESTPAPTATPHSSATPQPTPPIPPPPNSVKLLELPKEQPSPHPSVPQTSPTSPASPTGEQGSKKGYQPETRQTVVYGSISNNPGRSSVDAKATPLGKYKKTVSTAIGSRWYYYEEEMSPPIGNISVSFKVTTSGKVADLHVISSTSNSALTDCSLRSIMEAKIPPIPPDVAAALQNGSLEMDFSFTIY